MLKNFWYSNVKWQDGEYEAVVAFYNAEDQKCGRRWGLPLNNIDTLVWTGVRWLRFIMSNGVTSVITRDHAMN